MIDLGLDASVEVGDEVVVLGSSGDDCIDAYELAHKAGTIAYEIITNLNARLPRLYISTEDKE